MISLFIFNGFSQIKDDNAVIIDFDIKLNFSSQIEKNELILFLYIKLFLHFSSICFLQLLYTLYLIFSIASLSSNLIAIFFFFFRFIFII